jgi:phosphate uptake regulator
MKRKAIQLANQTIVISLPSKWVKQQGIKKGDDIDIEEKGKELIINSSKNSNKKTEIDISNLDSLTNRTILGLYISGADEIHIRFSDVKLINKIQREIMNCLIGFEIINQEKDNCIIKNVSKESGEEFDNMLKRIFLLINSMGEEILENLEKKNYNLDYIAFTDYNINRFVSFCLRYLNKIGFNEYNKTSSIYSIIQGLEHIGDINKKIAREITKSEQKLNKQTLLVLSELFLQIKEYEHLFYKYDDKKVLSISYKYNELDKKIKELSINTNLLLLMNELNRTIVKELLSNQLTIR